MRGEKLSGRFRQLLFSGPSAVDCGQGDEDLRGSLAHGEIRVRHLRLQQAIGIAIAVEAAMFVKMAGSVRLREDSLPERGTAGHLRLTRRVPLHAGKQQKQVGIPGKNTGAGAQIWN